MKVRISRDELLTGLQRVQGVVEKRNTMPILSNILLEAKHDGAEILR
jgi:DNA polymerase III subunit beta